MATHTLDWTWEGADVTLGMEAAGGGCSVVLLPALSSISTRGEMRPLMDRLAPAFHATTIDWPGFGDRPRPRVDWTPRVLSAFLDDALHQIAQPPHAVVAAGHAATYALHQAVERPGTIDRLVLIAPTWRGPLPTMMGGQRPWFAPIRAAFDMPMLGSALYRLNVSRPILDKMVKGHVYSDPEWLAGDRLAEKRAVVRAPGARHASVRFVSGGLDPVTSRVSFLDLARRVRVPILVVYGEETPLKSRADMAALAELPGVETRRLDHGKLAVHEAFPEAVANAIAPFLNE
ncbi:MAG: alpha/beta hydrolase [Xanthomonadales bacterium]|nr:alpha/beta hydrolase [Xanthomonadales bacterium]